MTGAATPTQTQFRVAIVGSGPSGFYAAEALLRSKLSVKVDVYEKLPVPFGLVRFGVAPDHPKLKLVTNVFDRIAQMEGFRFIGNVCIGKDVSVDELKTHYHAVIFACGAEREKGLGIAGEELKGSHSAREFVAWYNGHPEYRDLNFDFSHHRAVVIGQGNVALDVARILSKTVDELRHTDIADYALEALAESKIKEVYIIGRRGPAQAKFSGKELREFGELSDCVPIVSQYDLQVNSASQEELDSPNCINNQSNIKLLNEFLSTPSGTSTRSCHFQFHQMPLEILGATKIEKIVLGKNKLSGEPFQQKAISTGEALTLDCGMVFLCIGYRADPIPGLPYDNKKGVLSNRKGRIFSGNTVMPGLYATGWIKRGPSGTIGSNRADSVETVDAILEDSKTFNTDKTPPRELLSALKDRGCLVVDYSGWKKIDAQEISRGMQTGKARQKFTSVSELLEIAQQKPC